MMIRRGFRGNPLHGNNALLFMKYIAMVILCLLTYARHEEKSAKTENDTKKEGNQKRGKKQT